MHGSTKKIVEYFAKALTDRGIDARTYNLTVTDIGKLAMELVDATTVVIATPTVLGAAHPKAVYAAYLTGILRPKAKYLSLIGSFGWGGKTAQQIKELTGSLSAELVEPTLIKGYPKKPDLASLDKLADSIALKHSSIGFELLNG